MTVNSELGMTKFMSQKPVIDIVRKNIPRAKARDLYHDLLTMGWTKTILLFVVFFLIINSFFATLYWLDSEAIYQSDGTWLTSFFFSVQTLGTIGYGYLAPATTFANVLVTLEAALGLAIIAILTGLFFAKFSRPFAKIDFTQKIIIAPFEGKPTLTFRIINIRRNQIVDSTVHVVMLKEVVTAEGQYMRRFLDLKLIRSNVPLFAMSMNLMHVIDESSPLWGMSESACLEGKAEIMVTVVGTDGTFGQTIHAAHLYRASDLVWGKQFKDMVTVRPNGTREVDYAAFNQLQE